MTIFSNRPKSMIAGKQPLIERASPVDEHLPDHTTAFDPYTARCREVLQLWLRWHEEHQRLTEQLYRAGRDRAEIEQLLDECELLRQAAVQATEAVLAAGNPGRKSSE